MSFNHICKNDYSLLQISTTSAFYCSRGIFGGTATINNHFSSQIKKFLYVRICHNYRLLPILNYKHYSSTYSPLKTLSNITHPITYTRETMNWSFSKLLSPLVKKHISLLYLNFLTTRWQRKLAFLKTIMSSFCISFFISVSAYTI